jgi:biopolymer transport protein TolR
MQTEGKSRTVLSEINVTPFVDVMLVLLVIFMVTAPLIQSGVEVDIPETESKHVMETQDSDVILTVNGKREIFINKNKMSLENLRERLSEMYQTKRKKEIYLRADKSVPYGFVVKVMAIVKNAGIDSMGMITEPQEE